MSDKPIPAPGVFVHPQALCECTTIGENTRVWAFAHVLPGARIGRDCNICDHVFIENDVFIGPNATFSNDKYPQSKKARSRSRRPARRSRSSSVRCWTTTGSSSWRRFSRPPCSRFPRSPRGRAISISRPPRCL
jgi:NDP-sugar pyrophosphorylase family protein